MFSERRHRTLERPQRLLREGFFHGVVFLTISDYFRPLARTRADHAVPGGEPRCSRPYCAFALEPTDLPLSWAWPARPPRAPGARTPNPRTSNPGRDDFSRISRDGRWIPRILGSAWIGFPRSRGKVGACPGSWATLEQALWVLRECRWISGILGP